MSFDSDVKSHKLMLEWIAVYFDLGPDQTSCLLIILVRANGHFLQIEVI